MLLRMELLYFPEAAAGKHEGAFLGLGFGALGFREHRWHNTTGFSMGSFKGSLKGSFKGQRVPALDIPLAGA